MWWRRPGLFLSPIIFQKSNAQASSLHPFLFHCVCLAWADEGFPWLLHWLWWQIQDICSDVTPLCLCSCHTGDSWRHLSGDISSISPWHLQHGGSYGTVEPCPVASLSAVLKVGLIQVVYSCKNELTRLKAKLNQLMMKDAWGIFYHTLVFDIVPDSGHLNCWLLYRHTNQSQSLLLHSVTNLKKWGYIRRSHALA